MLLNKLKKNIKLAFNNRRSYKLSGNAITEYYDHDEMKYLLPQKQTVTWRVFIDCVHSSETYNCGSSSRKNYIDSQLKRLYRVFINFYMVKDEIAGPMLDVASGWGILYPAFKRFIPELMPYHIAEMSGKDLNIDGEKIDFCKFECDRDLLKYEDKKFETVSFIDCLEHLIVDPVWTLLEFNRVLKVGGHVIIGTPNVAASIRVLKILQGNTPSTDNEYKPSSIYQRHNREWTPLEVKNILKTCGFDEIRYSTNTQLMRPSEIRLLKNAFESGFLGKPFNYFGPEIFMIAKKKSHITLSSNLSKDERWPEWLYTSLDAYRKRPKKFPIIVSEDYG